MMKWIKKLLCQHNDILITTEMSSEGLIIAKSIIECKRCGKTFTHHPNAMCCYVHHVHAEILRDQFIMDYNRMKQHGK